MADNPQPFLLSFAFRIQLLRSASTGQSPRDPDRLGDGGFQECAGLEIEQDVQEYLEGGRNDGVVKRVGRAKFQNIVLKRGMIFGDDGTLNRDFWNWMQGIVSGARPVPRYDGHIEVYQNVFGGDAVGAPAPVAIWHFDRGLPAKVVGPQLNGKTGEIAIEELHIAHEGLRLLPE